MADAAFVEPTWADDQAYIESLKAKGGVFVGAVRFTRASYLDEAFERGRVRENLDAQYYRQALRDIAKLLGYEDYRQNPHVVADFVEWMRAWRERVGSSSTQTVVLAVRIRDLLWQDRADRPSALTPEGIDAIVDGVRVLLESAKADFEELTKERQRNAALKDENASLRMRANVSGATAERLAEEVKQLKEALAGERDRGYRAALLDMRKAAVKLGEERK